MEVSRGTPVIIALFLTMRGRKITGTSLLRTQSCAQKMVNETGKTKKKRPETSMQESRAKQIRDPLR